MLRDKGIGASLATWAHEGCPHFSTPPHVAQPLGQVLAFLQRALVPLCKIPGAMLHCVLISAPPPTHADTLSLSAMFSKLQGFVGEEMV